MKDNGHKESLAALMDKLRGDHHVSPVHIAQDAAPKRHIAPTKLPDKDCTAT